MTGSLLNKKKANLTYSYQDEKNILTVQNLCTTFKNTISAREEVTEFTHLETVHLISVPELAHTARLVQPRAASGPVVLNGLVFKNPAAQRDKRKPTWEGKLKEDGQKVQTSNNKINTC